MHDLFVDGRTDREGIAVIAFESRQRARLADHPLGGTVEVERGHARTRQRRNSSRTCPARRPAARIFSNSFFDFPIIIRD